MKVGVSRLLRSDTQQDGWTGWGWVEVRSIRKDNIFLKPNTKQTAFASKTLQLTRLRGLQVKHPARRVETCDMYEVYSLD